MGWFFGLAFGSVSDVLRRGVQGMLRVEDLHVGSVEIRGLVGGEA